MAANSARRADETKFVGVNPDKNWQQSQFFVTAMQKFCYCKIWDKLLHYQHGFVFLLRFFVGEFYKIIAGCH